jgi:D-sedoheptulose 7-phosphate isomerase
LKEQAEQIRQIIRESSTLKARIAEDAELVRLISAVTDQTIATFRAGGKVLLCGNGGSAADAQHLAAELSGRFYLERAPLFAEALHVNSSFLTAVANDYGFEQVFARMVAAKGQKGDMLIALSTSGNSPNVLEAIRQARECGMFCVGLTGQTGGKMATRCDLLIPVPSTDTPRIQEAHILVGHIICQLVEATLFPDE